MRISSRFHQAAILLFFACSAVLAQDLPAGVRQALRQAGIPPGAVGAYVQEVIAGRTLVSSNALAPLNPASTMKLVTTEAALQLLGPTYSWKTSAHATGAQRGDVLDGDLVIRGGGDPRFNVESLWLFLRQIREKGIRQINGDLVLDRSYFETRPFDAAQFDGAPLKPYNAGPDALLLNYHAFALRLIPDQASGKARVSVEPPVAGLPVSGPALAEGECGDWRAGLAPSLTDQGIVIDGAYPYACGENILYVHPYQMSRAVFFGAVFRRLWEEMGGTLKGTVRDGMLPPDARLVGEWQSAPLTQVIADINKFSNNVMARQLLLTLGSETFAAPANPETGTAAVRAWLQGRGIDAPDLMMDNGSGLSRDGRISAITMGRVLLAAYNSPTMPEFIASLPLAGNDGTMRKRLRDKPVAGRAHIKTGSLDGVRAIAGYVMAASGKWYALACMVNHPNAGAAREPLDLLVQWIYEHG
jgi:D-alanyl-D-alanine carboxypeptidase/D-alanyl-D-alanine-endopeptidase (penicillin-binding protein 4)